jgi:hypothetical protein
MAENEAIKQRQATKQASELRKAKAQIESGEERKDKQPSGGRRHSLPRPNQPLNYPTDSS